MHGEESFYIDSLTDLIEQSVLTEEEKAFNQMVVYAKDVEMKELVSMCKEFPMASEHKVVIVKEAQIYKPNDWEYFEKYIENIQPTTVLVVNHKYKKLDKRKKLHKLLAKQNWIYESSKLYENQIPSWISSHCKQMNLSIDQKSIMMLIEFLGTELSKIDNELKKLKIIVSKSGEVTPEVIEKNIGISKDYNVFELTKAVGKREELKCYTIVEYFSKNEKENPMVLIVGQLFTYFSNLMLIHCLDENSPQTISKELKINYYFASDYLFAAKNYKLKEITKILEFIKEADLKSKGIGSTGMTTHGELLRELIFKILNSRK